MQISNNYNNNPSFGAYFNKKNAIQLSRLFKNKRYTRSDGEKWRLTQEMDWFTNKLPNHELEITGFEMCPGVYTSSKTISDHRDFCTVSRTSALASVDSYPERYTIRNNVTGDEVNIFANDIFKFFSALRELSGILFSNKSFLWEDMNAFDRTIITKMMTKQ